MNQLRMMHRGIARRATQCSSACISSNTNRYRPLSSSRSIHKGERFAVPTDCLAPESPLPIVFLSGEYLNSSIWDKWTSAFSQNGYSGLTLTLSDVIEDPKTKTLTDYGGTADLYKLADNLQNIIEMNQLVPPLLICQSFSSHVALKFLESYPLAGLVVIDPIPPLKTLEYLGKMESEHRSAYTRESAVDFISASYRNSCSATSLLLPPCKGESASLIGRHAATANEIEVTLDIIKSIVKNGHSKGVDKDVDVAIEQNSVPMLVALSTSLRLNGWGYSTPSIDQAVVMQRPGLQDVLMKCHGLAEDDFIVVDPKQRYTDDYLMKSVLDWVDLHR